MKQYLLGILMAVVFLGLSAQGLLAAPVHGHSAHAKHQKGISPFQGKTPSHTIHCILLGHAINKPCPLNSEGQKVPCELSRPCHNGSAPGPASSGGSGHFEFAATWLQWGPVLPSSAFNPNLSSSYYFRFISPLDHPPQSV